MREKFNFRVNRYGDETQIVFFSRSMSRGSFDYENDNFTSKQSVEVDKQSLSDIKLFENQVRGYNNQYRSFLRSKQTLYDYSRSNNWEWFCTFTTSPNILKYKGINRYDENIVLKSILRFFAHFKERYAKDLMYVFIPELHKDGAVHLHGLLSNLPKEEITRIKGGVYKLNRYDKGFGYSNIQRVKDSKRVAAYITKYITKDLLPPKYKNAVPDPDPSDCPWGDAVPDLPEDFERLQRFYKHKYYVSKNVKKSEPEYFYYDGDLGHFIKENFPESSVQHCKAVAFGDEWINYIQIKNS